MSNSSDVKVEEKTQQSVKHGTVFSGYTVMAKSMIGSGILSITFACARTGLILGVFMLLLAAALTWLSLHVICKLSLEFPSDNVSFYSITENVFPKFKWLLDVTVVVDCLGSAICFLHIMGTLLASAFIEMFAITSLSFRQLSIITQSALVVLLLPICLMREITDTKIANIIGLLCLLYVAILAMVYTNLDNFSSELLYPVDFTKTIIAFPIMIFAFSCQQNVLPVSAEMKNPTMRRLDTVTLSAIATGLLLYLPVMILPYLTFGRSNGQAERIFDLLPQNQTAVIIGQFCAALSVGISFVLVVFPIRSSIMSLLYAGGSTAPETGSRKELGVRIAIVSLIVAICLGTSIGVGNKYEIALSFTGLLGANTCGFVMPFLMFLKHFGIKWTSPVSVAVLISLGFCLALYPLGITANILELVQ